VLLVVFSVGIKWNCDWYGSVLFPRSSDPLLLLACILGEVMADK